MKGKRTERNLECNLSLHDCLALGEVEAGLIVPSNDESSSRENQGADDSEEIDATFEAKDEEVHRLPILLRLLQSSRPLSSIPTFPGDDKKSEEELSADEDEDDPVICEAVARLEDRAALYSAAEGVQVVACHLAPAVTKRVSRVPPLQILDLPSAKVGRDSSSQTSGSLEVIYDTKLLEEVAENPASASVLGGRSRKKKKRKLSLDAGGDDEGDDIVSDGSDNEMDIEADGEANGNGKRRKGSQEEGETLLEKTGASEDSQEFAVLKTLQELIRLTVQSLKQPPSSKASNSNDDDGEGGSNSGSGVNSALSITMQDSILAEAVRSNQQQQQAGMSDLASTVASLMHHAPCLRHRHVATALCRAAFTQAPDLIARMGANCPAAVPSLVVGCVDVYRYAVAHQSLQEQRRNNHHVIAAACKKSIRGLAALSQREASRVRAQLHEVGVLMMDVQLELAMDSDPLSAACLLIQHLSIDNADDIQASLNRVTSALEGPKPMSSGNRRRRSSIHESNAAVSQPPSKNVVRSLQDHLEENPRLFLRTLEFLCNELRSIVDCNSVSHIEDNSGLAVSWGRACLFLDSYTWLLYKNEIKKIAAELDTMKAFDLFSEILTCLSELTAVLRDHLSYYLTVDVSVGKDCPFDRPYSCVLVALLATLMILFSLQDDQSDDANSMQETIAEQVLKTLIDFLDLPSSEKSAALGTRTVIAMKSSNFESMRKTFESVLFDDRNIENLSVVQPNIVEAFSQCFSKATTWLTSQSCSCSSQELFGIIEKERNKISLSSDLSSVISLILSSDVKLEEKQSTAKDALQSVLSESRASIVLSSSILVTFIAVASTCLHHDERQSIPIVLPTHIESVSLKVSLDAKEFPNEKTSLFLLQLVYCFLFLEIMPNSPFKFDPRVLPLKEVYAFCEFHSLIGSINSALCTRIKRLIDRHCPEVRNRAKIWEKMKCSPHLILNHLPVDTTISQKKQLTKQLRKSIAQPSSDPIGSHAEKAFIVANSFLSDPDLITTTASALISAPVSPPLFYTYPMLFRDPLTMLKCPLSVWNRAGLRRIALFVMALLLETNEKVLIESAPNDDCLQEYIHSRNEIVLRSLVNTFNDPSLQTIDPFSFSPMVTGLVRRMISSQRGMIAMVIKHNISENEVDWLVEAVPEMIEDASALAYLLSDRSTLSAAEKIAAADAILRIAIVHGHQDVGADSLVHASLSQIVASFHLIMGPTGVSTNTLVGEGSGVDVTKSSRRAAFRMLKILQKVRAYRTKVKNECAICLQKISGLCKGEASIGSAPSAIANRQKTLLKELLELVGKAADSMGFVIQIS